MFIVTIPVRDRTNSRLYDALWKRQLDEYPAAAAIERPRGLHVGGGSRG